MFENCSCDLSHSCETVGGGDDLRFSGDLVVGHCRVLFCQQDRLW